MKKHGKLSRREVLIAAPAALFTGLYLVQTGATSETLQLPDVNVTPADTKTQTRNTLHDILRDYTYQLRSNNDVTFFETKDAENLKALRSLGYVE